MDATEATIESYFERILYATLREIGLRFNPEKEVHIDYRRHIGRGRMDSRLGAVVIEYKRPSMMKTEQQTEAAREQLEEYLLALTAKVSTPVCGFLTDGRTFLEVRADNESITSRSSQTDVDAAALLRLTKCLVALDLTALTAENLIRDFCGGNWDGVLFETARYLNTTLREKSILKTDMLRSEWEELFRLAHDDQSQQRRIQERQKAFGEIFNLEISTPASEYQALFALHTAYGIVLKLIAYRVVSDLRFGSALQDYHSLLRGNSIALRSFCSHLEDGQVFRELGILNLLEGDFFSWYCDRNQWNEGLAQCVRKVIEILARYEDAPDIFTSRGAVDLFRMLYEATVPQVVRASFGEFYTPFWLADHVLQSTNPKGRWRALDPCCGSGTFVIAAISRIKTETRQLSIAETLHEILHRVVAIDLNPLAVLTTRIHYFIHISDLLPDEVEGLVIPVYLGDASYVPERTHIQQVECLAYQLRTLRTPIQLMMPVSLVEDIPSFVQLMQKYEKAVQEKDAEQATEILVSRMNSADKNPEIVRRLQELSKQLVELESKGWNGIWARIITNFLATACLGRFDAIVGNPPWIDWKNLPAGYREKIKSLCIDRGLFSGAGRTGGINLNVCALIAHVSITNWLSKSGIFAFLMPRELAKQASYEGWRRLKGEIPRDFLIFHDWAEAGHPFDPVREDFMTYVIGEKRRTKDHVPTLCYLKRRGDRTKAGDWKNLDEALSHLRVEERFAGQITSWQHGLHVCSEH